jgi:hypothetical protein
MRSPCEARAYHLSANDQPSAKYQVTSQFLSDCYQK